MPKTVNPALVEQEMQKYVQETVNPMLSSAFARAERKGIMLGIKMRIFDRADHIIIDGRTVKELALEEFKKTFKGEDFEFAPKFASFFGGQNRIDFVNRTVASAMMTGKQVDVFIPDPVTGEIQKEPTSYNKTGYEPHPLKQPKQMTRWQKFWSKLGFYKDKVAEQNAYNREVAKRDAYNRQMAARDRVKAYNRAARAGSLTTAGLKVFMEENWHTYHKERKGTMLDSDVNAVFRFQRNAMQAYTICAMLGMKDKAGKPVYTPEQVFDFSNPKINEVRANIMEDIYKRAEKNDREWLAEFQHNAMGTLNDTINRLGRDIDFSDPNLTEQKGYRNFALVVNTAFELSQETDANIDALVAKYGKAEQEKMTAVFGDFSNALNTIRTAANAEALIMSGVLSTNIQTRDGLGNLMKGQAVRQHLAKLQANDPDLKVNEAIGKEEFTSHYYYLSEVDDEDVSPIANDAKKLAKEYADDPDRFKKQIEDGTLSKRIKIDIPDNEKEDPKVEILDAARVKDQPVRTGDGMEL